MALIINPFIKQKVILGNIAARFASNTTLAFYPSSVTQPYPPGVASSGFLANATIPAGAMSLTNGQWKLNQIVNFTPTVTGTPAWANFTGGSYMNTDSIVVNGQVGMIVLSTLNFVAGQQVTLLDITLNIS